MWTEQGSEYQSRDHKHPPRGQAQRLRRQGQPGSRSRNLGRPSSPPAIRHSFTPAAHLGLGLCRTHPSPAAQVPPTPPSSPFACRPTGNDDIGCGGEAGLSGIWKARDWQYRESRSGGSEGSGGDIGAGILAMVLRRLWSGPEASRFPGLRRWRSTFPDSCCLLRTQALSHSLGTFGSKWSMASCPGLTRNSCTSLDCLLNLFWPQFPSLCDERAYLQALFHS